MLKEYGGSEGYRQYLSEVRNGRRESPPDFDRVLFRGCRASEMFIEKREEKARELLPEDALRQVLEVSGAKEIRVVGTDVSLRERSGE